MDVPDLCYMLYKREMFSMGWNQLEKNENTLNNPFILITYVVLFLYSRAAKNTYFVENGTLLP